jgi:hypothetical protein
MTDLKQQSNLTDGKGWKLTKFAKDYGKAKIKQITTKVGNIVGGIKATPKFIKRGLKNE